MPRYVILYRGRDFEEDELEAARAAGFVCTDSRMDLRQGDVCIPRYSALPYYEEQERDMRCVGASMLNTKREHDYCADLLSYAEDLGSLTPKTWASPSGVSQEEPGAFVLKGATNSKKFLWSSHMYAADRKAVIEVYSRLLDDTMICQQPIYVRRYVPLHCFQRSLWDLPITREFRFFVLDGTILSGGYYWASHYEELLDRGCDPTLLDPAQVPADFLQEAISRIKDRVRFFAIDVAEKFEGGWIVIEVNDGQQSGLSMNDPVTLYANLKRVLEAGCPPEAP